MSEFLEKQSVFQEKVLLYYYVIVIVMLFLEKSQNCVRMLRKKKLELRIQGSKLRLKSEL